jgi:hypothetical protein
MKDNHNAVEPFFLFFLLASCCIAAWGFLLSGCSSSDNPEVKRGAFVDSEVKGLEYRAGHIYGLTGDEGLFYYHDGATIVFSLGGMDIGSRLTQRH